MGRSTGIITMVTIINFKMDKWTALVKNMLKPMRDATSKLIEIQDTK